MTDPRRTRAIVVGIERYGLGERWDLDGPARDACRFVAWLEAQGVPAGNISLHLSPLPGNVAEVEQLAGGRLDVLPAGQSRIQDTLIDVAALPSDLLIVFWGGHGVRPPDEMTRLLCADARDEYRRNICLDHLLRNMRTTAFPQHPRQLIIVDACQVDVPRHWPLPPNDFQDGERVRGFRQQDALLAAGPGERAQNDDRNRTGRFSAAVLDELAWPAVDTRFDELFDRVTALVGTAGQQPARLAFMQDGKGWDIWDPAGPKAVPLTNLEAYRVPAEATPDDCRPPVDERDRVRLDVICCLRRDPYLTVLAGPADPGYAERLAAALTVAENHLVTGKVLPPEAVRRWQVLVPAAGRPPATPEEIGADPGWLRATERGAVVTGLTDVRAASEYVRQIRHLLPGVAVLCVADQEKASRFARHQELPDLLIAAFAPAEPVGRPVPHPFPRGGALSALVAHLIAYGARLPAPVGEPAAVPAVVDVVAWATQVVTELNDPEHPGYDEAALLTAARDRRPGVYPALLAAYAGRRAAPGRMISLTVAAGTDAELDYWLTHATKPPDPTHDVPGPEVVGALTIALRRRSPEAAAPWAPYAGRTVERMVTQPASQAPEIFATATVDAALLAVRCGLHLGVDLAGIEHAEVRPGAWALLAHRGITAETAMWLAGLDDHARRLVGLLPEEGLSVADRDALAPIRSALYPPLAAP